VIIHHFVRRAILKGPLTFLFPAVVTTTKVLLPPPPPPPSFTNILILPPLVLLLTSIVDHSPQAFRTFALYAIYDSLNLVGNTQRGEEGLVRLSIGKIVMG